MPAQSTSSSSSISEQQVPAELAVIPAQAVGSAAPSTVMMYGRHSSEGPLTSLTMQEWQLPGCKDHQVGCHHTLPCLPLSEGDAGIQDAACRR
jgi:hypothetical protein